jgi:hypothetical protein
MILVGRHFDPMLDRRYPRRVGYLSGATGLLGIGLCVNRAVLAFAALVLAGAAPFTGHPVFWQLPPIVLGGAAAAGGIALRI